MKHVSELTGREVQSIPGRLPYISVDAFCETDDARAQFEQARRDRRMSRVRAAAHLGGVSAAIALYGTAPTPDLVVLETTATGEALIEQLDALAAVCDAGTKVLIIGYANDIGTYRTLLQKGVSDYLLGPVDALSLVARIAELYGDAKSAKLGRSFAFVGAKGGVGSSTVAQNVASQVGRLAARKVILAELDLAFGTAGVNLDLEPRQGVAEAIEDVGRLDEVLLERLMVEYEGHLAVLTASANLERTYDFEAGAFDALLDVAQASAPYVLVDVPHLWTSWSRDLLLTADEVVVTAVPDLPNLRNAKQLIDFLKRVRPNDGPPRLVLNQVGVPKRKEIKPSEFAKAVGVEVLTCIPFEPAAFSAAAIDGKMIAAAAGKSRAAQALAEVARALVARPEATKAKRSFADLFRRGTSARKPASR